MFEIEQFIKNKNTSFRGLEAGKTKTRLQQVRCLMRAALCLQGDALVPHPLSWARKEQCVLAEMEVKG